MKLAKRGGGQLVPQPPLNRRGAAAAAVCPHCGSKDFERTTFSDTVDFRGLELDVDGLNEMRCASCGHTWATFDQEAENGRAIRDEYGRQRDIIRERNNMLTGPQISDVRHQLNLTQKEASLAFGGGPNSFHKYESGEVLQSHAMDKLLRLTCAIGDVAVRVLINPKNESAINDLKLLSACSRLISAESNGNFAGRVRKLMGASLSVKSHYNSTLFFIEHKPASDELMNIDSPFVNNNVLSGGDK
ncbi:hypothetical protein C6Q14_28220 [Burkholderia ambifaria]|uniref:type II TA system antitoxin MqsA family protein n=1 Tax=Burkholderia ambifaria TaxID=152480 RepID=UPI000D0038FB|nr:type II TA system antitoxin MqsA family protein [Burkholderia ambifaria]PRF97612.1 hypothetical protein C6Q14_28220 [Burkholderia ambifaria]